jgi:FixJ family two-component response regulator
VQRVLVLEDDEDLRTLLCELLQLQGVEECVSAGSLASLRSQEARVPGCGLAILDINLGAHVPSGLEAYRWLRDSGFGGRIVFLTGHARSHPLVRQAYELTDVQVLAKPVDARVLMALVEEGAGGNGKP